VKVFTRAAACRFETSASLATRRRELREEFGSRAFFFGNPT